MIDRTAHKIYPLYYLYSLIQVQVFELRRIALQGRSLSTWMPTSEPTLPFPVDVVATGGVIRPCQ